VQRGLFLKELYLELTKSAALVKKQKGNIFTFLKKITLSCTSAENANATFSTVHKAKGKEWDRVYLLNDYYDLNNDQAGDPDSIGPWRDLGDWQLRLRFVQEWQALLPRAASLPNRQSWPAARWCPASGRATKTIPASAR